MSTRPVSNEIVQVLIGAVLHALDDGRDRQSIPAARDVAQVLGLDGLDRALNMCRYGDPGTEPITRRLRALCEASSTESSLEPFVAADSDLGRLAMECGGVIEGSPSPAPSDTLSAAEALEDLPLADDASNAVASRVRLTPQVAAAVRAAIDWLSEPEAEPRRVRLRTEDSALEIGCARAHAHGVTAAAKVLAAIGGNLGPAAVKGLAAGSVPSAAGWVIRVPIVTPRETYLMVSQGDLELALPWHTVLRVVMTPRGEFDTNVHALGLPVLPPLVPLSGASETYPVVLIAHGLKRAYFVADRLIWRLPAEECDGGLDPRAPGHPRSVRAEDGAVYRVLDPARLLEAVEPFAIPEPERLDEPEAEPERLDEPEVESAAPPVVADDAPVVPGPPIAAEDSPMALGPPVTDDAGTSEFIPVGAAQATALLATGDPEPSDAGVIDEARVTPLPLRALVAEDSISARLVLVMLLEQLGFEVQAVGSAAELFESLVSGRWALVCVDIELPDASGVELLREAREVATGASMVALTRDGADELAAIEAGVIRSLGKPFSRNALARLLEVMGFERGDA